MLDIDLTLLTISALILFSIFIAKISNNLGVPTLLLFIVVGMLAGSEGPGNIYFDNYELAQSIGVIALVFILFSGGLDTRWSEVRPVLWPALSLSTLGVLLTATLVGLFSYYVLNLGVWEALLLGAVISSTDAAAVFSILGTKSAGLKPNVKRTLELESGSNDPMAVFLTIGLLEMITNLNNGSDYYHYTLPLLFILQMGIGGIFGYALGKAKVYLINKLNFPYEGIYPVFSLAFAMLIYALTSIAGGSGFLAVFVAALIIGNSQFIHKKSLLRFFDGLAWLSQIVMFLTLGLLVFPSHILAVLLSNLALSGFLIFIARPLSVFLCLSFSDLNWRDKTFLSWVGLRGAVPIILATFPLLAGIDQAELIFNMVFFVVITSTLLQGWTTPFAAKILGVVKADVEFKEEVFHSKYEMDESIVNKRYKLTIEAGADAVGKALVHLNLPPNFLIVMVKKDKQHIIPSGKTVLEADDILEVITDNDTWEETKDKFLEPPKEKVVLPKTEK